MTPLKVGDQVTVLPRARTKPHLECDPHVLVAYIVDAPGSPGGKLYRVVHDVAGEWQSPIYGPFGRDQLEPGW